jgi:hypothetical protein
MRKLLPLSACVFLAQPAFAGTETPAPENVSVKIDFSYERHNENGKADQIAINSEMRMKTSQHAWTVIQNRPSSKDADRFVLLGKVDKAYGKHVRMSFLLIDTEIKKPTIISRPDIKVNYGEKGQITVKNESENMHLSLFTSA